MGANGICPTHTCPSHSMTDLSQDAKPVTRSPGMPLVIRRFELVAPLAKAITGNRRIGAATGHSSDPPTRSGRNVAIPRESEGWTPSLHVCRAAWNAGGSAPTPDLDSVLLADRSHPAWRHAHRAAEARRSSVTATILANRGRPFRLAVEAVAGRPTLVQNAETISPWRPPRAKPRRFQRKLAEFRDPVLRPAIAPIAGLFCPQRRSAVSLHTREATRPVPCVARHHEAHASRRSFVARERVLAERSIDGSRLSPTFPLRHPHSSAATSGPGAAV